MGAAEAGLSPEMEDYLETIAALSRTLGEARVTDIAARLAVRKASVTQALQALAAKGLVSYRPYVSPTLTATGRGIAERVQQRHDVLKSFLVKVLLIEQDLAEANACRLEHAVDREVLEHLAHFMDFVQRCPRGGAKWIRGYEYFCDADKDIAQCERCLHAALEEYRQRPQKPAAEEKTMTLAELQPGQTARIVHVGNAGAIRRRIVDMGAVSGTRVTLVKVAPLGDPLEVKIRGYNLTLRKAEAAAIEVAPAPAGEEQP